MTSWPDPDPAQVATLPGGMRVLLGKGGPQGRPGDLSAEDRALIAQLHIDAQAAMDASASNSIFNATFFV